MTNTFVHLHVHTDYSLLDGAAKIDPLVRRASELGMPAIGMSDHGNMFGSYDFFRATRAENIKPILGIEAYVAPASRFHKKPVFWGKRAERKADETTGAGGDVSGSGSYLHKTMWATGAQGLRSLFKLSSLASIEGHYRKWPRMDDELLAEHAAGVIATTGCPSGAVQTRLRLGQFAQALEAAATYRDIFGKDQYFVELMDHGLPIERRVRDGLLEISRRIGIPPLVTNDSHYVSADQADIHDALLCVGTGTKLADPNRFRFGGSGYYLKTAEEMLAADSSEAWQEGCRNTLLVAEQIGDYDEVFTSRDLAAKFPVPDGESESSWLRRQALRGAERRYGEPVPVQVRERIDYELGVIEEMGFPGYFLVVADLCRYARDNGIRVGPGRGSATGSMVAYVTGITELDPIEHGLLFERFLNPERVSMPDVDLDFDERRRADMIRYVTAQYGEENVSLITTFSTIKAKAAIKDACRILDLPFSLADRITKSFPPAASGAEIPLAGVFDQAHPRHAEAAGLRELYASDPDAKKAIDLARGLEGTIRGTGVHAAGVILSSRPLIDVMPMHQRPDDGVRITGFDAPACEALGALKMDFLGLRNLTVLGDAVTNIKTNRGLDLDLSTIPLDDSATFELLRQGWTLGVFQLDSPMMRDLTRLMAPSRFEDVSVVLALGRPGPMGANAHVNYARRKVGRQPITSIHPELTEALEPILGSTYHLVVYQEQVMAIAQRLAGYTLGGADLLRRAMSKKKPEEMVRQWEIFSTGMASNGYSAEAAKAVWDALVPFSAYGFNKSHTAGYGLVAYWTAFLKANYPIEYMAALLTSVQDDKDKMALYLAEARRMGVKILPPDVNASQRQFAAVDADIRFGLNAIRNIGEHVVEGILAARTERGRFRTFGDFLDKVPPAVCNRRVIESLIKAGAFDGLGHTRNALMHVHRRAVDAVAASKRHAAHGQQSLFADLGTNGGGEQVTMSIPALPEWDRRMLLTHERQMLGLYVSGHPLDGAEALLRRHRDVTVAELLAHVAAPALGEAPRRASQDEDPAAGLGGRQGGGLPEARIPGRDGESVRLAGVISHIDRKMSRKGHPWAVVKLEDVDGTAIEVVFSPQVYSLCAPTLRQDQVVQVNGLIHERDGSLALRAQAALPLNIADTAQPPIVITMPERHATADVIGELKRILQTYPGTLQVHLHLSSRNGASVKFLLESFTVDGSPSMLADIKALLGPASVTGQPQERADSPSMRAG